MCAWLAAWACDGLIVDARRLTTPSLPRRPTPTPRVCCYAFNPVTGTLVSVCDPQLNNFFSLRTSASVSLLKPYSTKNNPETQGRLPSTPTPQSLPLPAACRVDARSSNQPRPAAQPRRSCAAQWKRSETVKHVLRAGRIGDLPGSVFRPLWLFLAHDLLDAPSTCGRLSCSRPWACASSGRVMDGGQGWRGREGVAVDEGRV